MQIRITDIDTAKTLAALADHGFGIDRTDNQHDRIGSPQALETAKVWTDSSDAGPGGYEVGILRRECAGVCTRHELILETGRIEQNRLGGLLVRLARDNG